MKDCQACHYCQRRALRAGMVEMDTNQRNSSNVQFGRMTTNADQEIKRTNKEADTQACVVNWCLLIIEPRTLV